MIIQIVWDSLTHVTWSKKCWLLYAFPPPHLPAIGLNQAGASVSNRGSLWLHNNFVNCQTNPADVIDSIICLSGEATPGLSHAGEFGSVPCCCTECCGSVQARLLFFFLPKNISCSFFESGWRWKKRIWCLFAAHCLFFYSNNDEIEDKYVTREKSSPWLFI